jgi:hypothetical protein
MTEEGVISSVSLEYVHVPGKQKVIFNLIGPHIDPH